jgi:hypothetical protein
MEEAALLNESFSIPMESFGIPMEMLLSGKEGVPHLKPAFPYLWKRFC